MEPLNDFRDFERFIGRFTNYERAARFRYDRKTLGPERMRALSEALGAPHSGYATVHIAGSKGKGSTCLMLEALLAAEGLTVGTYTSPHVEHLTDRIRVASAPVPGDDLVREMADILPYLERCHRDHPDSFPSFFELMTALAMTCFRSREVDWGIFEVGLGGRLDATNILRPDWTAITSIGLEHTHLLGKTLGRIAREKAGIIKESTPVVLGPLPREAERVVRETARKRKAPIVVALRASASPDGPEALRVEGIDASLPAGAVRGPALRTDFGIAYTLFREILLAAGRAPTADVVRHALSRVRLPARCEVLARTPPIILDGAHTEDSVRALRQALDEIDFPRPRTLVFSVASDKRLGPILEEVTRLADDFVWTRCDPIRSVPPESLRERAGAGDAIESPEEAFAEARRRARPIVVTGSLYLAGRLRHLAHESAALPTP